MSATDFQGAESFHMMEGEDNPLLRVYSSTMASRMSLLATKRGDMLRQLVTHVPDLVVDHLLDSTAEPPVLEKSYGVLVFADVSGTDCMVYECM